MLTSLLTKLNPYATYIKIGAGVLIISLLVISGVWIRGVFAERDELRQSVVQANEKTKVAEATTQMYADEWNKNQAMQEGIANAVKQIKVTSHNYIQAVEASPPPSGSDGTPVVLMRVNQALTIPAFDDYSASRTAAVAP